MSRALWLVLLSVVISILLAFGVCGSTAKATYVPGGASGGLPPTSTKTAAFDAYCNNSYLVNTTTAAAHVVATMQDCTVSCWFWIKKNDDNSTYHIQLNVNAGDTIEGLTTFFVTAPREAYILRCNGAGAWSVQ